MGQAARDRRDKCEGLSADEREELSRLRYENKILKQEREFLKKRLSSSRGRKAQ
jgi:hypothetical protein